MNSFEICRREDRAKFWNKLFQVVKTLPLNLQKRLFALFLPSRYTFFVWGLSRAFVVYQGLEHCYNTGGHRYASYQNQETELWVILASSDC